MNTKWIVSDVPQAEKINAISETANVSKLMGAVLAVRGYSPNEAVDFINKDQSCIYDPFLLKDMNLAVDRIKLAIKNKEHITIYGDYDADGVTSCALLTSCLSELGADVDFYIPERETEGYGMSSNAVDVIKTRGTTLIITVDCGITAVKECDYAKSLGIDIVITDHHECGETIPDAVAVVDPKQNNCMYPFKMLAGVGVALKLAQALFIDKFSFLEVCEKYSEFVTIGTIADIAPLIGENRVICDMGLRKIKHTTNHGIKALINVSGIDGKSIDAVKIGFILAPKINAVGRLENASRAINLFLTDDCDEALKIAKELHEYNLQRQQIEAEILVEAEKMLEIYSNNKVIVLNNKKWHHGVVGIVSSRLTKKYNKPCILISPGADGYYKGSGRSIEGFSLYDALSISRDTLVRFGGHELAAGIVIEKEKIEIFRAKINEYADQNLPDDLMVSVIKADCELRGRHLNLAVAKELEKLQPFGVGNPQPVFYIKDLTVLNVFTIGNNKKHLKLRLLKDGICVDAIAFGFGDNNKITYNSVISIMCNMSVNEYKNNVELQLKIIDIK